MRAADLSDEEREEAEFQTDLMIEQYRAERRAREAEEASMPLRWTRHHERLAVMHSDVRFMGLIAILLLVLILWRVW